jgi:uncharacterized protein (DUF4415 family)
MTDLAKLTPPKRAHYHYMADAMRRLEWDLHHHIEATSRIPLEWHAIARNRAPQPKTKITIWVDSDVLRFFKSLGTGYQARLNDVLRSFVHARLAGVIRGGEAVDFAGRAAELHDGERPLWGDMARRMGTLPAPSPEEVAGEMMARAREKAKMKTVERK